MQFSGPPFEIIRENSFKFALTWYCQSSKLLDFPLYDAKSALVMTSSMLYLGNLYMGVMDTITIVTWLNEAEVMMYLLV